MPAQLNTTESTFFTDAKRFLEPLKEMKIATMKNALDALWQNGFNYLWIFIFAWITSALEENKREDFVFAMSVFIAWILIHWIIKVRMYKWGFVTFFEHITQVLKESYGYRLLKMDNSTFELIGTGKIQSIVNGWLERYGNLLHQSVRTGAIICVSTLYGIGYLLWTGPFILLAAIIVCSIAFYISRKAMGRSLRARREKVELVAELNRHFIKMVMSKFEIIQNQKIIHEVAKWKYFHIAAKKFNERIEFWSRMGLWSAYAGPDIIKIGLFFYFGFWVLSGTATLAEVIVIGGFMAVIERVMQSMTDLLEQFNKDFIHVQKLWETFDATPEIQGYDSWKIFSPQGGKIELSNIYFNYGESAILKNFSVVLTKGKKTALVGASGGGKTTIMKLIAGYLRPTSGNIIIDGQKLEETALKTYYPHIGYLTQEPSVFDGSIRENLLYGAPERTSEQEILRAIKQSQCQFVLEFEGGLDTEIGEKGVRLSGGQRQRLAIAKIFLKNPEIILLDEPTSALDSFSEERITEALNELFNGRTVVIIAHRLQTVRHADEILVIERGQIVERGNHTTLSQQKKSVYAKMLELQSGI